jgi:arylsulfatase A-like enzyme
MITIPSHHWILPECCRRVAAWTILAVTLHFWSFNTSGADKASVQLPNIVLILADDLGYGDLSCYGQKTLPTPNLDKLAAEGMRFTRHYAGSTVCAPSRCVLMTGLHTGHAPLRTNYDTPMPDSVPTLATQLKQAGYATGAFGKWGLGDVIPPNDPNRKGFGQFYGYVDMYHAHNFFPPFLVRNGQREPLNNDLIPGSDAGPWSGRGNGVAQNPKDYAPDFIVNEALRFIDAQAQKAFFLYLAFNTPHANNEGGKNEYKRGMEVPDFGPFANRDWPDPEKGFARKMADIDRDVARVVAKLREHGLAEKTLVIFTSDNGPHQEGGHQADFFDSNGPLRGRKRDVYEGGIRVPTIAWWPGRVPAGTTSDHLSGFQDYLPTFCELAGAKLPKSDGLSLVPTLLGKTAEQRQHEYLYWEFYEGGGKQAVATEKWKAVRLNWNEKPDGPLELYDLQSDLGEEHNLAADHPEVIMTMQKRLTEAHVTHSGQIQSPGVSAGAKKKK